MIVHLILNSHLDPVWLWNRAQGIDEVLATARTACEILDEYPEIHLTRGEVWFYETVERLDPETFERIRAHVRAGRWRVVGNWYMQPDCNLPQAVSFRRHNAIGTAYFREKFGIKVTVGYNVDSFGHAATLPDFYGECGIDCYVMQRPGPAEKKLPANTFRWISPNGGELLTFRLAPGYNTDGSETSCRDRVAAAVRDANSALGHTMCFVGVGDHGGGPVRAEIEFLRKHLDWAPGVKLEFSHPEKFFAAVRSSGWTPPTVRGELQHHAIGCYSAVGRVKREIRDAEDALVHAENLIGAARRPELTEAWKKVLFATFHDVHAGSCIESAYSDIYDELAAARSAANNRIVDEIRRRNLTLPPSPVQRLIFDNPADTPFTGLVEFEPWRHDYLRFVPYAERTMRIVDPAGAEIPTQSTPSEARGAWGKRFAAVLSIPPRGRLLLGCALDAPPAKPPEAPVCIAGLTLRSGDTAAGWSRTGLHELKFHGVDYLKPPLRAIVSDDPSDTWSHGLDTYGATVKAAFQPTAGAAVSLPGPLAGEVAQCFAEGARKLRLAGRLVAGVPGLELRAELDWTGLQELVKLEIRPAFAVRKRTDATPGGEVERALNGEEYPFHGWTLLEGDGRKFAILSRDVFSLDVRPNGTVRLTLLRSPYYAHHAPNPAPTGAAVTDQGKTNFTLLLLPEPADRGELAAGLNRLAAPVRFSETTCGMETAQ